MSSRLIHGLTLFAAVFILYGIVCFGSVATAHASCNSDQDNAYDCPAQDNPYKLVPCWYDTNEQCIEIELKCTESKKYGNAGWYNVPCVSGEGHHKKELIHIPSGRPIYAFLVNGFDQNHNFDMFHFYNFAKHIFKLAIDINEKAYVHFAWWNNLLAPYMQRPLHNAASVPSRGGALNAGYDYFGFDYDPDDLYSFKYPTKAIPAEDYQFQKDARAVLCAIHAVNPAAVIILVGHSMGGDAVIRLADSMPPNFPIALLAPIDPVGNRTCLPSFSSDMDPADMVGNNTTCNGAFNFTRFQATHTDQYWSPYRITFSDNNIGYLYHRWQTEWMFPFDYGCPNYKKLCGPQKHMKARPAHEADLPYRYLFRQNGTRKTSIGKDNHNVQARVPTSIWSGTEVYPDWWNCWNNGGGLDGHGEIVGFRALQCWRVPPYSFPLALKAQGGWPRGGGCEESKSDVECRIYHLKKWEANHSYLDDMEYAPTNPEYCLVSEDLKAILDWIMGEDSKVNYPPVADANGTYQSECEGASTTVSLDGSGSYDPEESSLEYLWQIECPGVSPEDLTSSFDDDKSETPVLTMDTSNGCDCTVQVTVRDNLGKEGYAQVEVSIGDTVSPNISCPTNTTIECNESTDPSNTGEATGTDLCDPEPDVTFTDVLTPGLCPEGCTITRTWAVTDCCENTSSCVQTIEVVDTTGGVKNKYSRDADEDGYGDPNNTTRACSKPSGYVTNNSDCDDTDPNEHPDQIWYRDTDSDRYSDGSTDTESCIRPIGFKVASELIATSWDCNDNDQNQYPGAPEICLNWEDDDCDGWVDEIWDCNWYQPPPVAEAGSDQTVVEGETVKLDGSKSSDPEPGDNIASYQWTQLGGIPVTLSDPTAAKPIFVTPIVYPAGMILTFELVVKDKGKARDSDKVTVTVNDNGITGFPDDVLTMTCSTGKEIGIKVESDLVSITTVDPATIPDSSDKPDNLPYGLFDLLIKTDAIGGTAKVTFYLESKAGDDDKWSKHITSTGKWEDCSAFASCNAARDQFTITLVDGGDGDDGPADGWIVDPSGLGSSAATTTSSGGGGGGGGGCFIQTLGM